MEIHGADADEAREEIFQRTFFHTPTGRRLRSRAASLNPAAFRNCFLLQSRAEGDQSLFLLLIDAEEVMEFSLDRDKDSLAFCDRRPIGTVWQAEDMDRRARIALRLARRIKESENGS